VKSTKIIGPAGKAGERGSEKIEELKNKELLPHETEQIVREAEKLGVTTEEYSAQVSNERKAMEILTALQENPKSIWMVAKRMTMEETRTFLENLNPVDAAENATLLSEFKRLRVLVATKEMLRDGQTRWDPSVLDWRSSEPSGNHGFARWIRGEQASLANPMVDASCWETILVAAYKAGVMTPESISSMYRNAAELASFTASHNGDSAAERAYFETILGTITGGMPQKFVTLEELEANPPPPGAIVTWGEKFDHHMAIVDEGGGVLSNWIFPVEGLTRTKISSLTYRTGLRDWISVAVPGWS
jgi:hypothetical protein